MYSLSNKGADMKNLFRLTGLAALLLLTGCGIFTTAHAWFEVERSFPDTTNVLVHPAPILVSDEQYQRQVSQFALMALFAKVVYRHDLPENTRLGSGCRYLDGSAELFGMPHQQQDRGWRRLAVSIPERGPNHAAVTSCVDRHGLYYETYVHVPARGAQPDMAVIAIRGTENYAFFEQMRDWRANFSAAVGSDPAQYKLARQTITPLLAHLAGEYGKIPIYVTGHSLGGGIAQQMAYTSERITAAYVFDSSPVTNWSQMMLMKPNPIIKKNPIIHRVNHVNEFLQAPRLVATRLTSTRIGRADYDFAFQDMARVDAHEMGILACHLAVRMPEQGGDFDFPASYVKTMIRDPALCPNGKDKIVLPEQLVAAKLSLQ